MAVAAREVVEVEHARSLPTHVVVGQEVGEIEVAMRPFSTRGARFVLFDGSLAKKLRLGIVVSVLVLYIVTLVSPPTHAYLKSLSSFLIE